MSIPFGTMLPGEKINFSLDLTNLIPAGQTLASAVVNVRNGAGLMTFSGVGINQSKVVFRAEAIGSGRVTADVIGTFSDGQVDGDQIEIVVA